ncbi:hypothetical protein ILUMI_12261 [Ignelater luminosus]|uniref:Uncharacterized protein n=1 Tax=Ignelater luminosus TaxID=2038154 RepID=A0A8K0CUG7_IGNLU|nr:hypothetical protein ILUMI_12261 [Ignelater luminosus]
MSNINNLKDRIDNRIELLLKAVAEEEGFQDYKIEKAPGAIKGDGYLGFITAICVTGKTNSGKEKTLHLMPTRADQFYLTAQSLYSIFELPKKVLKEGLVLSPNLLKVLYS